MPYGLPCPDKTDPSAVFSSVEQFDVIISDIVQAVLAELMQANVTAGGLIGPSLDGLTTWLKKQLASLNKTIGDVYNLLKTSIDAQVMVINSSMMTTITDIANELQSTTTEVMYGPPATTAPSAPFPQTTNPANPQYPPVVSPLFPATTAPESPVPPAQAAVPGQSVVNLSVNGTPVQITQTCPPVQVACANCGFLPGSPASLPTFAPATATTISIDGNTIAVSSLCPAVQAAANVTVGGHSYTPTFQVYTSAVPLPTNADGSPRVSVAYDVQPDGSLVVQVGPIAVQVTLQPTDPNANAPACRLDVGPPS